MGQPYENPYDDCPWWAMTALMFTRNGRAALSEIFLSGPKMLLGIDDDAEPALPKPPRHALPPSMFVPSVCPNCICQLAKRGPTHNECLGCGSIV